MSAPLAMLGHLGEGAALLVALLLGVAFGWCLERGGMGSARKLAGQFLLTDLAVLKVMFSAIITASLGLFWLGRLGVLDLSLVYVPETFIGPQLVGGIVFGAGFAVASLCPGTSCVAAVTGRLDGLAAVAGMFAGVLAYAELYPRLQSFAESGARGSLTIPAATGISQGAAVFALVALALAAFAGAERIERWRRG